MDTNNTEAVEQKPSSATKRAAEIALKICTWLLVIFTVFMMIFTVVTVSTVDKNERGIFGYRFYIVKTDSMSESENNQDIDVHFNAGDIVVIKKADDATKLEAGQIIAFISTNSDTYGETVTHMIREPKYNNEGRLIGYVTYGTNTGTNDEAIVEPDYVLGTYTGKMPTVGRFFAFVKTDPGYIICILIPFVLLILYNGVNVIRLFRRYKKEQTAEIEAEKAEIAAEKQRNEEMFLQLQALKAQLEGKVAPSDTAVAPDDKDSNGQG